MLLPSIFLSYARADDEPFVKKLYESLTTAGFQVWWDRVSMPNRALTFLQEIRDAIEHADHLVLVVGPNAIGSNDVKESEYVRAEWQHALEYCKPVHPVLRLGDYNLLPSELKLLDTPDFRDDDKYDQSLEHLLRHLNEPVAPLGKFVAVPDLPPHFLPRPADLNSLKQSVLADMQRPVVVTGTARRVGLQGMGGIGKSVLATSLARDCEVRRAFPDGVLWVALGQSPNLTSLQYDLCLSLGAPPPHPFVDINSGKAHLSTILANKACLLILDDIWQAEHADAFDASGSRCRMLITTRDMALITALGAHQHRLEILGEEDALNLMAGWLLPEDIPEQERPKEIEQIRNNLPETAHEVARECGYLPLALALSAANVRDEKNSEAPWSDLLDALREADLEFFDHPHGSILKTLKVSIDALENTNPDHAKHYLKLAIFPEATSVPESTIVTLWTHSNGLNERNARKLIRILAGKALIHVTGEQPNRHIELHDLQHVYLRHVMETLSVAHNELVEAYRRKCPDGWHTGPNDGYFFEHLVYHLHGAGHLHELRNLLISSSDWMETKFIVSKDDAPFINELRLMESSYSQILSGHHALELIQLRIARCVGYVRSSHYELTALILSGYIDEAIKYAKERSLPEQQVESLRDLAAGLLQLERKTEGLKLLQSAYEVTPLIADIGDRATAIYNLAGALTTLDEELADRLFDESYALISGMKEVADSLYDPSLEKLLDLARVLATSGRLERARQIMQEFYQRANEEVHFLNEEDQTPLDILFELSLAFGLINKLKKIEDGLGIVQREITRIHKLSDREQTWVLIMTVRLFALAKEDELALQYAEQALEIAKETGVTSTYWGNRFDPSRRASNIAKVAGAIVNVGHLERAREVIQEIEVPYYQAEAYSTPVPRDAYERFGFDKQYALGWVSQAFEFVLNTEFDDPFDAPHYKGDLLDQIAISFAKLGNENRAFEVLNLSRNYRAKDADKYQHRDALVAFSIALAQSGWYDQAIAIASIIAEPKNEWGDMQHGDEYGKAIYSIALELAKNSSFERAHELLQTATCSYQALNAQQNIVTILAQANEFDMARSIANKPIYPHEKAIALAIVAEKAARQPVHRQLAESILDEAWLETQQVPGVGPGNELWDIAVIPICNAMYQLGNQEEVLNILQDIAQQSHEQEVLVKLVASYFKINERGKALEIVVKIRETDFGYGPVSKARTLCDIVEVLIDASEIGVAEQVFDEILALNSEIIKVPKVLTILARLERFSQFSNLVNQQLTQRSFQIKYTWDLADIVSIISTFAALSQNGLVNPSEYLKLLLEALVQDNLDSSVSVLSQYVPLLEAIEPGCAGKAMQESIRIIGWVRPDWQEIYERLTSQEGA